MAYEREALTARASRLLCSHFGEARLKGRARLTTMKKRIRPIQYLLSADSRLRRLSMRRVPSRAKTANGVRSRTARSQKGRRSKTLVASRVPIVLAIAGIVAAGGFLAARQASSAAPDRGDITIASPAPAEAQPDKAPAAQVSETKKVATPKKTAESAVKPAEPVISPKESPTMSLSRVSAVASTPDVEISSSLVTISGCLESDADAFRLKDTSGAEAPKSRSWKSGFLKKHSASVDVIDPGHNLNLAGHVGQRVSATGTLNNREMRAQSLQSVSPSCR